MSKTPAIHLEVWPIEKILPYEQNVKIHDKVQVARIARSIAEFGWDQPIVVDADGIIIKGHGRRLAAISLGYKDAPVWQRKDLSPDQARAARLADNRAAVGDVDPEMLRKELAELDFDMTGIFDAKELDFLSADLGTLNDDAFVGDLDAEVKKQSDASVSSIAAADSKPVAVAEALGFKAIPGKDQRVVARFMARIEAQLELPPDQAFLAFIRGVMEGS